MTQSPNNHPRPPKIVVIGAASSSFSGLLADMVANPDLDGAQIALVDIDTEGLAIMTGLGQRMAREWGTRTEVSGTPDRREALKDADFIIATIAVGGLTTWRQDEEIPARFNFGGCSVDTVGPGGIFRGLRLIPPMIDICRDVEDLCPDAWVINYSNPMTAICRAVQKATRVNVVGLCTAGFLPRQVARHMGIEDVSRVKVISAGLNHWVWALRILVDGRDAYEEFTARMRADHSGRYYGSSVELLDLFGVWPMPGANHVAEFFPYFYGNEDDGRTDAKYSFRTGHDFDERLQRDTERRAELKAQAAGTAPLGHKPEESGGEAVRMLISMQRDRGTLHYVNIANHGLVPNLPDEAVVEVPAIADAAGIRGLQVGPLPASVIGLVQARWAFFELLAEAALQKSKHLTLQCLMADTNTTSIPRARECVDAMFAAQAAFLPGFD